MSTCQIMMSTCQIKLLFIGQEHAFEVDQHSVLNGLNHALYVENYIKAKRHRLD